MNSTDEQYLSLGKLIEKDGVWLEHKRTGLRRRTFFHYSFAYDLRDHFPIISSKRVAYKTAIKEMEAYLDGVCTLKGFHERGLHTWDQSYINWKGSLPEGRDHGPMGPIYGMQWLKTLGHVIGKLQARHDDGNLYITAVNSMEEKDMCLPACMHTHRWQLAGDTLHQVSFSRSSDYVVGLPFNMVQAGWLFLYMCSKTGLKPGQITHHIDNAHVYEPHYDQFLEQLKRTPGMGRPWLDYKTGTICGYTPLEAIKYENVG